MLIVVREAVNSPDESKAVLQISAERLKLAKRIWRGVAEDGQEFGFQLQQPLKPGETVFETGTKRYVVAQTPEPVLEVDLDFPASAAAGIGWAVGNLHLDLSAEPTRLLTPDSPAARQLFARLAVNFRPVDAIFRPGRFSRGGPVAAPVQELGPTHQH